MRINIIPIRELFIPIIRFHIANTNRTNLFFNDYKGEKRQWIKER